MQCRYAPGLRQACAKYAPGIHPDSIGLVLPRTHNDEYALLEAIMRSNAAQVCARYASKTKTNYGLHEINPDSIGLALPRTHNDAYALLKTMMNGYAM